MIYPAIKKYSEAKKYIVPMAIGAGTGLGLRAIAYKRGNGEFSPEDKALGYAGAGIAGAGSGLMLSGLGGSSNDKDRRFQFGAPIALGGTYLMGVSNNRMKEKTRTQSLGDALYLPMVGAGVGAGKALYENNYGSMKDMPRLNKRYNLIGSSMAGFGGGQAIAYKNPLAGGLGLAGGIMGLELANRSKYGPRLEDPVAGDGSSTVAAVNGSGL